MPLLCGSKHNLLLRTPGTVGDIARVVFRYPLDRLQRPVQAPKVIFDRGDCQILRILALHAFYGGYVAQHLLIAVVERKRYLHCLRIVPARPEPSQSPAGVGVL